MATPNAGYRIFNTGDVLTAAQVQYYLQNQTIMFFANAAARDAALTAPIVAEGMFAYLADTNTTVYYDGAAWQSFGTGDVTGLTAGAGITITNASGPVPTIALSSNATLVSPKELTDISATGATGTVNIDISTASVEVITANATGTGQQMFVVIQEQLLTQLWQLENRSLLFLSHQMGLQHFIQQDLLLMDQQ